MHLSVALTFLLLKVIKFNSAINTTKKKRYNSITEAKKRRGMDNEKHTKR